MSAPSPSLAPDRGIEMNISPELYPILAIVYSDGLAADRFISDLGYRICDAGIGVAGIVQQNKFIRGRTKCDMAVEELASGPFCSFLRIAEGKREDAEWIGEHYRKQPP